MIIDPTDPSALGPSTVILATAQVPLAVAWERFVPIELPSVFPRAKGPIPSVVSVEGQTGRWDEVGRSRTVILGDGSRVEERVSFSDPTRGAAAVGGIARFGYTVSGFSGPLGRLTSEARGFWRFEEDGACSRITWTYGFRPTGALAQPILGVIIWAFWRRYMQGGMTNVVRIIERAEC